MFHLLRRQLKIKYRKPLIVFTPKSLLRHPRVLSTKEEFANGSFQMLIDDAAAEVSKIKTLVFVSGKFYYDLLAAKEAQKRDDVAIVRVEQLFPLPSKHMKSIIKKYKNADDLVWAQEEPRNMGAYSHILMHFEGASRLRVCSRKIYAAPASGSSVRSKQRQNNIIKSVFNKSEA
jgi:2-oxoglutarate dehydrogenase E1 component